MASPGPYPYSYAPPPRKQRSLIGPLLLIAVGMLFLLHNFGISMPIFQHFNTFWPLLLIVIGLARLAEVGFARYQRRAVPVMGGGTVFLLVILVCVVGTAASVSSALDGKMNLDWLRDNVQLDEDLLHSFEHTYDGDMTQDASGASAVQITNDRGSVTVNSWDQPQIKLVYHKRVLSGSRAGADEIDHVTQPKIQVVGSIVEVQGNNEAGGPRGVVDDLELYVPAKLEVRLSTHRGDISVTQRVGDLVINSQHGDITLDQVTGNATVTAHSGSVHLSNITGNASVDGRIDDLTLESISGTAAVTSDIFGNTRLAKLAHGVSIHTSRTELQVARLDGELTMDSGELQGQGMLGPVTLTTRAKNVNLRSINGDVRVNDDRGDIELESGGAGNLDLTTHHGDIRLRLPAKASFQYQAMTRKGGITNEFGSGSENENRASTISGVVGHGGIKVNLVSDTGDIELTKTDTAVAAPEVPAAPQTPAKPGKPAKGEHKKASETPII